MSKSKASELPRAETKKRYADLARSHLVSLRREREDRARKKISVARIDNVITSVEKLPEGFVYYDRFKAPNWVDEFLEDTA